MYVCSTCDATQVWWSIIEGGVGRVIGSSLHFLINYLDDKLERLRANIICQGRYSKSTMKLFCGIIVQ